MRSTFAGLALVAVVAAKPIPQSDSACSGDYSGTFSIQVTTPSAKAKRQSDDLVLTLSLAGGILTDSEGRTGYIAANHQFQFDSPPQDGSLQVDDFNVCGGYLAHGDDTTWDSCLSGEFSNLYDNNVPADGNAGQCTEVNIQVFGSDSTAAPSGAASQIPDGQPQATTAPVAPVTQISDGQPQASTAPVAPVTQIGDGQPQAPTAPAAPVTQIQDGQPQAPTAPVAPVTQIGDGQPQAPTAPVAPVTQISDGQPQAPTAPVSPVTQISDGQPQVPIPSGTGVAPYPGANTTVVGAAPTASVVPATGAASSFTIGSSIFGLVAAVAALAMFQTDRRILRPSPTSSSLLTMESHICAACYDPFAGDTSAVRRRCTLHDSCVYEDILSTKGTKTMVYGTMRAGSCPGSTMRIGGNV